MAKIGLTKFLCRLITVILLSLSVLSVFTTPGEAATIVSKPKIVSIDTVYIKIQQGGKVTLPSTVKAHYSNKAVKSVKVTWPKLPILKVGANNVTGTVYSTNIKAKVVITVTVKTNPSQSAEPSKDTKPVVGATTGITAPENQEAINGIDKALWEKISSKVGVVNDIRLFTLYAFMNFTGYDEENPGRTYSAVRESVRNDLSKMNLHLSDNSYYKNKGVRWDQYIGYLRSHAGTAPDFSFVGSENEGNMQLRDLNAALKEFYSSANIQSLYDSYKPIYENELKQYREPTIIDITHTIQFLRMEPDKVPDFHVEVNLLDAFQRGFGLGPDNVLGNVLTTGPSNEVNRLNIVHEFLHSVINPIINNNRSLLGSMTQVQIKPDSVAYKQGYTSWESIVTESIIRALSPKIVYGNYAESNVTYEDNNGFVLTSYVFSNLKDFPNYNGSLEDFIKKLLSEYK